MPRPRRGRGVALAFAQPPPLCKEKYGVSSSLRVARARGPQARGDDLAATIQIELVTICFFYAQGQTDLTNVIFYAQGRLRRTCGSPRLRRQRLLKWAEGPVKIARAGATETSSNPASIWNSAR